MQARLIEPFSFFKQFHDFVFGDGVFSSIFLLCQSILACQVWHARVTEL